MKTKHQLKCLVLSVENTFFSTLYVVERYATSKTCISFVIAAKK